MKKRYNILFVSHENTVNGSSVSLLSLIIGLKEIYGNKIKITVLIPTKLGKYNQAEEFFKENGIQCKKILYRNNYKNIYMIFGISWQLEYCFIILKKANLILFVLIPRQWM